MIILLDDKFYVVDEDTFRAMWATEGGKTDRSNKQIAEWVRRNGTVLMMSHFNLDDHI